MASVKTFSTKTFSILQASRRRPSALVLIVLLFLLALAILLSVGIGAVKIAPSQLLAILFHQLGLETGISFSHQQEAVLLAIRLPRVVLGVLVGAALAMSGAAMQGLFRNPLADPGLLGVSSGAGLAAVGVIVLGDTLRETLPFLSSLWLLPVASFLGGLCMTLLVYSLATVNGRTLVTTMLLAGVAIGALSGALTGLLTFIADDDQLLLLMMTNCAILPFGAWEV